MSYILEALKKAQAERQLGDTPTIHAPHPIEPAPAGSAASRTPLLAGLGVLAVAVPAALMLLWSRPAPVVVAQATQPVPAAVAPAAQPVPAVVAKATQPAPTAAAAPTPGFIELPAVPVAARDPSPSSPRRREPMPSPPQPERPHDAAPAPAPVDESVRPLAELPEAIQREVPKVAFGGYIYSPNPADRLLLVDKMLRHEGEEVAPGLVLEKLLPKAAVMNYKGYRYRVGY